MNTQNARAPSTTEENATASAIEATTPVSGKAAYIAARQETTAKVNAQRAEFLAELLEAEEIHVEEDYKEGLLVILEKYPTGLPLATIQRVFGDAAKLRIAKNELHKAGRITEINPPNQKNTKVLALAK